ncbi:MAG: hypothetical protein ABEI86_01300 [Halobacteriaceae archaeon]
MPFIGKLNGDTVVPVQIDSDDRVKCPSCGSEMGVRKGHTRSDNIDVERHFFHVNDTSDCSGGESTIHQKMKAIASSRAARLFPNATIELEKEIGNRRADVFVAFKGAHQKFGKGICIECQYKNIGKNKTPVEQDYLDHNYSTIWLREDHFDDHTVDLFAWKQTYASWAREVPPVEEWEERHNVIQWLEQEHNPKVEIEVDIPIEPETLQDVYNIKRDWRHGASKAAKSMTKMSHYSSPKNSNEWTILYNSNLKDIGKSNTYIMLEETGNGSLVLSLTKKGQRVTAQISKSASKRIRELANVIESAQSN